MNDLTRIETGVESPARFTIDEFMQMIDSGVFQGSKVELVDGVVVRMTAAMSQHMLCQRQIFLDLDAIFGNGRDGRIVQFELSIQFGDSTLRDIDVGVVAAFDHVVRFPDPSMVLLAIEISATTLAYDLNDKRRQYAGAGIPHYWVVDLAGKRVHVMSQPVDSDYVERYPVAFGQALGVPSTDRSIVIG